MAAVPTNLRLAFLEAARFVAAEAHRDPTIQAIARELFQGAPRSSLWANSDGKSAHAAASLAERDAELREVYAAGQSDPAVAELQAYFDTEWVGQGTGQLFDNPHP